MEHIVKTKKKIQFIDLDKIIYFESVDLLVKAISNNRKVNYYDFMMSEVYNQLSKDKFFRISDSYIINVDYLKKIKVNSNRKAVLHNNVELSIDPYRYNEFISFLKFKYNIN